MSKHRFTADLVPRRQKPFFNFDIRNTDPGPSRYTSLAWAAVHGHEEIFDYLLNMGHDEEELSRVGRSPAM